MRYLLVQDRWSLPPRSVSETRAAGCPGLSFGYGPTMTIVDAEGSVIRVAVPASPEVLHLLRSVTASVGARMSMPLDDVEELRIAVDEAATLLLDRVDGVGGGLELALVCADRSLTARVSLDPARPSDPEELRSSWPWRVISRVTDGASIDRAATRMTISFTKSTPGSLR
jgi:serine/threonine-protein kinase RsbW